jgi:hypothetical protein
MTKYAVLFFIVTLNLSACHQSNEVQGNNNQVVIGNSNHVVNTNKE